MENELYDGDNVIYMPAREDLGHVLKDIAPDDPKRETIFAELGKRVLEHSEEVKRYNEMFEGEDHG